MNLLSVKNVPSQQNKFQSNLINVRCWIVTESEIFLWSSGTWLWISAVHRWFCLLLDLKPCFKNVESVTISEWCFPFVEIFFQALTAATASPSPHLLYPIWWKHMLFWVKIRWRTCLLQKCYMFALGRSHSMNRTVIILSSCHFQHIKNNSVSYTLHHQNHLWRLILQTWNRIKKNYSAVTVDHVFN